MSKNDNFTYIAECADGTYYTGWTTDVERREKAHNSGKGAKYTRCRLPVKIIYFERFDSKQEAQRREWQIKQLTRAQKEKLINKK